MLVTHSQHPGVARKERTPSMGTVIGKALEEYNSTEIGTLILWLEDYKYSKWHTQ